MATVTLILGLCGSGKTWLANRMVEEGKIDAEGIFDEGFLDDEAQHQKLISLLRSGTDCVVVEIHYCQQGFRDAIVAKLTKAIPHIKINWICIENDLCKANKNCRERTKGEPEVHVNINNSLSPIYKYPDGADIRRMWTKGF